MYVCLYSHIHIHYTAHTHIHTHMYVSSNIVKCRLFVLPSFGISMMCFWKITAPDDDEWCLCELSIGTDLFTSLFPLFYLHWIEVYRTWFFFFPTLVFHFILFNFLWRIFSYSMKCFVIIITPSHKLKLSQVKSSEAIHARVCVYKSVYIYVNWNIRTRIFFYTYSQTYGSVTRAFSVKMRLQLWMYMW